jgi:hypothetical protein
LVATLTNEFQTASENNVSTITVCRGIHEMVEQLSIAEQLHKPKITICNAKHRLEWGKACRHWTLEQ